MKIVQLNLSTNMGVPWLMAAPGDTEVIPSLLRPLCHGIENLTDLSVIFIPGNQLVVFAWPIMPIKQENDLKTEPGLTCLSPLKM